MSLLLSHTLTVLNGRYLIFSYEHRLYLLPRHCALGANHFGPLEPTSLKGNSRWGFSFELPC